MVRIRIEAHVAGGVAAAGKSINQWGEEILEQAAHA